MAQETPNLFKGNFNTHRMFDIDSQKFVWMKTNENLGKKQMENYSLRRNNPVKPISTHYRWLFQWVESDRDEKNIWK